MKRRNFSLMMVIVLLCCLILSSCGASGKDEMEDSYASNSKSSYDYEYGMSEGYYEKIEDAKEDSFPALDQNQEVSEYGEKIIRDVTMSAETREFDRALAEIRQVASACGGYEQSVSTTGKSYSSGNTYRRVAKMVLRIPAEALDDFLGEVGNLVNVTSQAANSTNVTTQYYDIKSRISVLESEKAAYEEMLKKSDEVEYLLKIKDRLYDVIEEIESYETQLRLYDNKVAYSTVTMSLEEVIEYSPVVTPKDTFGTRIGKAFTESWKDFASGFQSFLVWFVYAIPTLLVLAIIAGVAITAIVLTSRRARERAKKNKTEEPKS